MNIFTTINPYGNFESQNEALTSWSKEYKVYSINTKEEIELSKDRFSYINFIESNDFYNHNGKKLTKLNSILNEIKNMDGEIFAIVNSDIILDRKINLNNLNFDLIMATRWELDNGSTYPFNSGYDLFIFNKKIVDILMNDKYVIGLPWWDFWIPVSAIRSNIKIYHIKNKIISHRTHDVNYDSDVWIKFGEHLYRDIMKWSTRLLISINLLSEKDMYNVTVFDFCENVKRYIENRQIEIELK